jgi:cystathionine beta-lyase
MTAKKTYTRPDTVLAVAGRDPDNNFGIVNPPVYHASTILSPTMEKFENRVPFEGFGYGRNGTPTQKALEDAVAAIEGAHRSIAVQSGLAAVTGAIVGFLKTGDHLLLTDNVYGPARRFANTTLKGFGVETTFFNPMLSLADFEKLIRPNTKVVYLEAPGSQTFEVQDVAGMAAIAKKHGAAVLIDNTWATPLYFRPFDHGCDISVHAGTKYIVGHSDAMMGIISCKDRPMFEVAKTACQNFGCHAAPDDSYLALRGLRTMGVRLRHHEKSGLHIANWLKTRPEVDKVLHPALPDCPGHENWKKLFLHPARRHDQEGGRRHARRHGHLRHGRLMGRLREPADPRPPGQLPHRRAVAQGQADPARPYRPGGRRRPQDRPGRGLRPAE